MPFDFAPPPASSARGKQGYLKGLSAEEQVARRYRRSGAELLQERWRGNVGEIDLIFRSGKDIVFVEVKASKSHARAAARVSAKQAARICATAEEFLGTLPSGSLTPMRIDVATVDAYGSIEIIENALM